MPYTFPGARCAHVFKMSLYLRRHIIVYYRVWCCYCHRWFYNQNAGKHLHRHNNTSEQARWLAIQITFYMSVLHNNQRPVRCTCRTFGGTCAVHLYLYVHVCIECVCVRVLRYIVPFPFYLCTCTTECVCVCECALAFLMCRHTLARQTARPYRQFIAVCRFRTSVYVCVCVCKCVRRHAHLF